MIQQQEKSMELIGRLRHFVPCDRHREWPVGESWFGFKELNCVYSSPTLRFHDVGGLLQQRFRDTRITQNCQAVSTDIPGLQLKPQVSLLFAEIEQAASRFRVPQSPPVDTGFVKERVEDALQKVVSRNRTGRRGGNPAEIIHMPKP